MSAADSDTGTGTCALRVEERLGAALEELCASDRVGFHVLLKGSATGEDVFLSSPMAAGDSAETLRVPVRCLVHLVAGIAVLRLCRSGALDLDHILSKYLPELGVAPLGRSATVRHALTHTTGYQALTGQEMFGTCDSWDDVAAHLIGARQLFRPGTVFDSQRMNSVILAEVTSRVAGKSFVDYLSESLRILTNARLTERKPCFVAREEDRRSDANSLIWTQLGLDCEISLSGLVEIARFIGGPGSGEAAATAMCNRPFVWLPTQIEQLPIERLPESFGLGVAFYSSGFAGSDGSSDDRSFCLRVDAARGLVFGVVLNSSNVVRRSRIVDAVYDGIEANIGRAARSSPTEHDLSIFEGIYHGAGRTLFVNRGSRESLRLKVVSNSGSEAVVRVLRKSNGTLTLDPQFVPCGFFFDPADGMPSIMIGQNAYKRSVGSYGL